MKTDLKIDKINDTLYLEEIDKDSYSNVFRKKGNVFQILDDILVKPISCKKYDVIFKCSCCNKWEHEKLNRTELISLLIE